MTGSTAGLGHAVAVALGEGGAKVAMNYANNEERAGRAFEALRATGCECGLFRGSVVTEEGVNRLVGEVSEKLGPVDIVVVNATPAQPQKPIEEYDWETYQAMLDFFVKSPFLLARACLPHMKSQRWGRIVNIGSEVFQLGVPNFSAYVAAKGGQSGWTRSMATELASWGITVNMVSPGWIPVERHANDPQEAKDGYLAKVPAGRWGVPGDIAAAVLYLAGEESAFVTGQNVAVNGGLTVG